MSGSQPSPPAESGPLHWTVHPAASHPGRAGLVLSIIGLSALLTGQVSQIPFFGWAALVVLLASVRAYFLPRTYELDENGAREAGPLCPGRSLSWTEVRRVVPARFGIHLSPRHSTSRLLPDHGLFLRTIGNRAEVMAYVEQRALS